ncbi:MAG: hypothetical protein BWY66_02709 [bacterium ADurb.Bin374]|nr:MAG: hypothetical protein BWY66_02709 [bacterium ADurb.Bin374]
MKTRSITNEEIRQLGLKALLRDLGPEGLIRFLQQFGVGSGDYTKDRGRLFPDGDIEDILAELPPAKKKSTRRNPLT